MSTEDTTATSDVEAADEEAVEAEASNDLWDGEEPSIAELEEQDWPSPGEKSTFITHEFMDGTVMTFKVQDPDEESIMEFVMGGVNPGEERTQSQVTFDLVSQAVIAPRIPIEKWQSWRAADRMTLGNEVAEAIGLDRVMGFSDGGLEQQLEELLQESAESGGSQ